MILPKALREALRQLGSGPTWTITMVEAYYQAALKLEKLGLVKFKPRYVQRGKFRGMLNGYDVVVRRAGRALLQKDSLK